MNDNSVLDNLKTRLKETEKGISNLVSAIEQGIITSSTKERLVALEAEKDELIQSIRDEEVNSKIVITREDFVYWSKQVRSNAEDKDKLFECFLNSAYLYDDHIVINSNLLGPSATIRAEQLNNSEFECDISNPA